MVPQYTFLTQDGWQTRTSVCAPLRQPPDCMTFPDSCLADMAVSIVALGMTCVQHRRTTSVSVNGGS